MALSSFAAAFIRGQKKMAQHSFVGACKLFFGFKEGQSISEFGKELKDLSHEEKMEIARGLRAEGIDCDDPIPPAAA